MAITANKKFWTEFIEIYHNLPSLWNTKDENYNNRETRSLAWNKLVEKLKEVEPNANQDSVKRKINTFRSNFNRELRKIRHTEKELPADVYNPTLWYFNHLSFLLNQEKYMGNDVSTDGQYEDITLMGLATAKNEIIENETRQAGNLSQQNVTGITDNEKANAEEFNCNNHDKPIETEHKPCLDISADFETLQKVALPANNEAQQINNSTENQNDLLNVEKPDEAQNLLVAKSLRCKTSRLRLRSQLPYNKNFKNNSQIPIFTDEAAIYGQAWACGFRKLSPQQKLYAKKAIDEILILGQLKALKLQTLPINLNTLEEASDQG